MWKAPWERTPDLATAEKARAVSRWTATEWASINSFVARCTASDLLVGIQFDRPALQVLNHALEIKRQTDALEENIPAAAVWILYA
jgi:hypothetical protein